MNEWSSPTPVPPVITWYKVYCSVNAAWFLFVAVIGILLLAGASLFPPDQEERFAGFIFGPMYIIMDLVFMVPFIIPLFLSPKPWVWVYGIVMIAVGMTSCCCLPATIPLLIYWIRPEAQAYFGRQ